MLRSAVEDAMVFRHTLYCVLVARLLAPCAARAQSAPPAPTDSSATAPMHHHHMEGMDMSGMDMSGMDMEMHGAYGPYPMTREASGTAWQPDAAGHHGIHVMRGDWSFMLHGMADIAWDQQG